MTPTKWWQYRDGGAVTVVARTYWPDATLVEVNDGSGWRTAHILTEIMDDPSWEAVDKARVDMWLDAR